MIQSSAVTEPSVIRLERSPETDEHGIVVT